MITAINSQIETYALATFPDNFLLPLATYGDRGEEQWYLDFPEELNNLEYFTNFNYNLVPGQTVTTTATVYQFGSYQIRPNAYAFFDTGSFTVIDGQLMPVYMVIVAKYFSTDSIGYNNLTYSNSVTTYGIAYYAYNQLLDTEFYAVRLYIGYVPSVPAFENGGILYTLYNIGQFLVGRSSSLLDLLNTNILGTKFWQILFGGGFVVYVAYCVLKWVIPL